MLSNTNETKQNKIKQKILLIAHFSKEIADSTCVSGELAIQLANNNYVILTSSNKNNKITFLFNILATIILKRNHYDFACIEVFSGQAFLWAKASEVFLRLIKKPFILILHGGNLPDFAQNHPRIVRNLLISANVVIAPSRYLLSKMQSYRSDIRLLPNPIDPKAYDYRVRTHPNPTIVWVRSFHKIYNPSMAPKVIAMLVAEFPDLFLTMVGADKGDGSFQLTQQIAKDKGVSSFIKYTGKVSKKEVPGWLQHGDIFINTTNIDNTPISILEAMASGLVVVSTRVGGISYLLTDGEDALLVPPDDPEAMAAAIKRILSEPGLGEKLSLNGQKKIKDFDWSVVLAQWETVFNEIA